MVGWLMMNTIFPLSPVLLAWICGHLIPKKRTTIFEIIKDGQLFFYCTGTIAVALNEISTKALKATPDTLNLLHILLPVFACLFGCLALNKEDSDAKKTGWISLASVIIVTSVSIYIRRESGAL
jgi:threonine/homoserine efflux transporter RhtA